MKQPKIAALFALVMVLTLVALAAACINTEPPIEQTTITYMSDGEVYATVDVSSDEIPSAPANPEKAGYKFMGWFEDEAFATPFNFAEYAADEDRTNITVYAKFEIISTSVTYMVDDVVY